MCGFLSHLDLTTGMLGKETILADIFSARMLADPMPVVFDSSKPLQRLRSIAESLGWRGLELWCHTFEDRSFVHWYQTSDHKFMLWITEYPLGQNDTFAATVHADRYGICSGHHRFSLSDPESIASLSPWVTRGLFWNCAWRRQLKRHFPECCLDHPTPARCNKKRATREWPPYEAYQAKPAPPQQPTRHAR